MDSEKIETVKEETAKKYYHERLVEAFVMLQLGNMPFINNVLEDFEEPDEQRIV